MDLKHTDTAGANSSENLINLNICTVDMRKLFAILKALLTGAASIDSVRKTAISITPGDVTQLAHN